jgi:plasmid maintenance system killer protein
MNMLHEVKVSRLDFNHAKSLYYLLEKKSARGSRGSFRYHGRRNNRYSVSVDENYCVAFRFVGGHAYEEGYEDYH